MQTRSFDEIKALYESAKSKGLQSASGSLADYSNYMQSIMPDENWSAGLQPDNWVGSFSRGVDSLLYNTGIPEVTGNVGASLGSGVDALTGNYDQKYETLGRGVGESIPRGLIDTGLILGGGAVTTASGGTLAPLGYGMIAAGIADAGIKGYADTGSVGAGLANAGMMAVAPYVAGGAGSLAAKPFVSAGGKAVAATLGGEAAMIGLGAAKDTLTTDSSLSDNLFANTLGSVMFAPFTVKQGVTTYRDIKMKQAINAWIKPKAMQLEMEGFVPESKKGFMGPERNQIFTGPENHSLVDQGKLFDYLVGGKKLSDLPKGSEHLVKFLEDAGVSEQVSGGAMGQWEMAQRLEKGRSVMERAVETEGDVSGLVRKASKLLMSSEQDVTGLLKMMKASNELELAVKATRERQARVSEQAKKSDRLFRARTGTMPLRGGVDFLDSISPRLFEFDDESMVESTAGPRRETIYLEPMDFDPNKAKPLAVRDQREVQVPGRIMLDGLGEETPASRVKGFPEIVQDRGIGTKRFSATESELEHARNTVSEFLSGRGKVGNEPAWMRERRRETGGKGKVVEQLPQEVEEAMGVLARSGEPFQLDVEVSGSPKPKGVPNDVLTPEERKAWEQEQKDKFGGTMKEDKGKVVRKPKAVKPLKLDPTEDEYADFKAQRLELLKKVGKKLGLMVRSVFRSEVRYNIRGGNVAQDANGMYTAASVKSAIEQLTPLNHGDQNLAAQRVANMVKADLQTKVEQNQQRFVDESKRLLSGVFRKLGLSMDLENEYLAMAERVLMNLDQQQGAEALSMLSTRAIVEGQKAHGLRMPQEVAEGVAGMALPGTSQRGPLITLSPVKARLMPSTEPSGIAFEKVHSFVHESIHGTIFKTVDNMRSDPFNPGDPIQVARETAYLDAMEYLDGLSVEERTALVRDMSEFTVSHFPDTWARRAYGEDNAKYAGDTPIETLTEYSAQVAMHLWADPVNAPSKLQSYLRHLPEPIQQFIQKTLGTMADLVAVVIGGARQRGWDDSRVSELQRFHNNVLELVKPDVVKVKAEQKLLDAAQGGMALERGDYGGLGVQFKKSGSQVVDKEIGDLVKQVREPGKLARNIAQHQQSSASQWAREHIPQYERVSNILTRLDSEAVRLHHLMRASFMVTTDGGFLSDLFTTRDKKINNPEKIRMKSNLKMVANDRKLHEAVNEAMRTSNDIVAEVAQTGEAYPTFDHPAIQKLFDGFSTAQREAARAVFDGYAEGNKQAAGLHMTMMQHKMASVMSRYLYGGGFSHEDAGKFGKQLSMALISDKMHELAQQVPALGSIDPATQAFVPANESVAKAIKHWENVKDKFQDDLRYFDRPHFSEMRTGRFYIRYDSGKRDADGNVVYGSRSSGDARQRDAILLDLQKKGLKVVSVEDRRGKDQTSFGQMRESGLDEAAFRVEQHFQMHKEAFLKNLEPELAKQVEEEFAGFNVAEPLLDAAADKKTYLNKRTFAPGREYIDMITAQNAYTALVARKVANVLGRIDANWEMQHSNWLKFPKLREEVNTFKNNILNQGRQQYKPFRKMVTALTLGGNVSAATVDATQPVTMGVWRLTEEVGITKALILLTKSYIEAFRPIEKMESDYREVLIRATNEGLLKTGGQLDDMINIDEHTSFNVINAASNRDMVSMEGLVTDPKYLASKAFEMIGKLGNRALDVSMTPHRMSSQINNRVMLWAGLQVAKSKGLTGVDAQNFAINMMQTSNVSGGRAAHSSFKTKAGMFNGVVEAATLMTNYPIAAISQMYNSWKGTLKSMGLSPEARKRSQQAFYGQLLTQFALAGSLGLGLDALFRVSKEWFGVDPEDEIRKGLATIDESGWIADAVLNGLGNQLTGIDLASRYSLSGIGGLNSYTGFEPRGLFGAGGSLISALYNAPNQIANNDLSKINLIPVGVRRMIGGITGQGTVDQSGQRMIDPTQTETLMQLVGFKPARLTQMQNMRQRLKSVDEVVVQKLAGERKQMAASLLKGDLITPMQWVRDRINKESEYLINSGMDEQKLKAQQAQMMRTEMLELIDYAVDKALPQDPMSTGSRASAPEREALMRSYPTRTPLASQLQREQLKQRLAAQVGIRPTSPMIRPRALQQAQAVDQIRQQQPGISLSTAKEIAK